MSSGGVPFSPRKGEGSSSVDFGDLPPAYTSAGAGPSKEKPSFSPAGQDDSTWANDPTACGGGEEDPYALLARYDTVVLIDDSASMECEGRWQDTARVLSEVAPRCTEYDEDGIEIYFLNHRSRRPVPRGHASGGYYNIRTPNEVTEIFRSTKPTNGTPTGARLDDILGAYLRLFEARHSDSLPEPKPLNLIVITDGCPSDEPADILRTVVRRLDALHAPASQVGVQFFQVGSDSAARKALIRLDDKLKSRSTGRDIVDAVTWDKKTQGLSAMTGDGMLKVALGGVNKRLDNQPMDGGLKKRLAKLWPFS